MKYEIWNTLRAKIRNEATDNIRTKFTGKSGKVYARKLKATKTQMKYIYIHRKKMYLHRSF